MKDNFFVATAIPYANAKPHLGNALEFLYGDVLARYHRNLGQNVIFSIGTDEHGGKMAAAAASLQIDPQQLADRFSAKFRQLAEQLQISQSHFIRTTDKAHCQKVQLVWRRLEKYIYKGVYEEWYCQGCEAFQTETVVQTNDHTCPDHNRPYQRLKEENYFFKLTAFADRLEEEIASDRLKIIPDAAKAETLNILAKLRDVAISRPVESVSWGIGVPDDPSQVIYVWFDALLNYITVLDYPDGAEFKSHWPADVQIVGRDILRFHALIWPALLLALELPPYRSLYVHGLITVDGQKMSKSIGNVVDPKELVEAHGIDAFRYFFLRHLPAHDNGDYSRQRFVAAYNNELVDQLGNLVHRLQALVCQKLDGRLPATAKALFQSTDFAGDYHSLMADCHFNRVLSLLFTEIKALNRLLEEGQPWMLDDRAQIAAILDPIVATLKQINCLLEPFLPLLSQRIAAIFASEQLSMPDQPLLVKIQSEKNAPK